MKILTLLTLIIGLTQTIQAHASSYSEQDILEIAQELGVNPDQPITLSEVTDSQTAELNDADPLTDAELLQGFKSIGKGVMNRKTSQIILLACAGPRINGTSERNCSRLQHVYFSSPTAEPKVMGEVYQITANPNAVATNDELTTSLKSLSRDYRKYKYNASGALGKTVAVAFGGTAAIFFGSMLTGKAVAGGIVVSSTMTVAIVGSVALLGVITIGSLFINKPLFDSHSVVTQSMNNQNGWNWSNHPTKVSARTFKFYYDWAR